MGVRAWTEKGCEKQRLWTDCSLGWRAMWAILCFNKCDDSFHEGKVKIYFSNGDLGRRERDSFHEF